MMRYALVCAVAGVALTGAPASTAHDGSESGAERIVLEAVADTWVGLSEDGYFDLRSPSDAEEPRGGEPLLVTGRHGEYRGVSVAFVGFGTPDVAAGRQVLSARLELLARRSIGGPLPTTLPPTEAFEVLEPWDEATLDAYNAPRLGFIDRFVQPVASAYAVPGGWVSWDVTASVERSLVADRWHGFWLITGEKQWVTSFASRESGSPPRLVLELGEKPISTVHLPLVAGGAGSGTPRSTPTPQPPIARPALPPADAPGVPRLAIAVDETELEFGTTPELAVEWQNITDEVVPVILPVDASTYAWRMPMYVWEVTDAEGQPPRSRFAGRCSCFDPLRAEDFAELAPGSRRPAAGSGKSGSLPGPDHHFSFVWPGSYTVRLIYMLDRQGGVVPPDVADQWARARDAIVVSRPVTVTVGPPTGAHAARLEGTRRVTVGMDQAEVEAVLGPVDQVVDEAFAPYRRYLAYYLADPRDGEPAELPSPQTDMSGGDYWRPRFIVTLGGEEPRLVHETVLLP